jgi:hypothetical protein
MVTPRKEMERKGKERKTESTDIDYSDIPRCRIKETS